MSDLIDRKEALKALREIFTRGNGLRPATVDMINAIKFLPSAESKKGKWVDRVEMDSGGYPFKVGVCCSVCGAPTLSDYNYCPHCGSKMEVTE